MKFQCERCKTRYSIADEKVRGKILKIRCKTCSSIVTVRDPTLSSGQAPALSASGSFGAVPSATGSLPFVPRPAPPPIPADEGEPTRLSPPPAASKGDGEPPPDEWFISIDGRQEGPFTPEQAQARVARRRGDEEMFAWREDFSEWLPVEDVPLLARHVPKARPPAPPSMFGDAPEDAEPPPRAPDPHDGMDFNIADASRVVRMPLLAPSVAGRREEFRGRGSVANGTAPRRTVRDPSPQESLQLPIADLSRDMLAQEPPRATTDASVTATPPHKRRRRAFYLVTFGGAVLAAGILVGAITLIGRKGDDEPTGAAGDPAPQVVTNFYEKNSILQTTTPVAPPPAAGEAGGTRGPASNGNGAKTGSRRAGDVGSPRNDPPRIGSAAGPGGKVDTFSNEGPRVGPLTPDDVRETYLANEVMLKRCYERSLKADMSAPVSKMDVKITIDAGGSVTRINVPQESGLSTCVATAIRNWRFRRSSDGLTTEFTVVFAKRG